MVTDCYIRAFCVASFSVVYSSVVVPADVVRPFPRLMVTGCGDYARQPLLRDRCFLLVSADSSSFYQNPLHHHFIRIWSIIIYSKVWDCEEMGTWWSV